MARVLSRLPTSTLMALAFTVPAALTAASLVGYHSALAHRYLSEEWAHEGRLLAEPILGASERFLRDGSVGAIQRMIEDTAGDRTVRDIALVGGDGLVIASSRREWIGRSEGAFDEPAYAQAAVLARSTYRPALVSADGGARLVLVSPLLFQGSSPILADGARAVLYLKLDRSDRMRAVSAAILRDGAISAAVILAVSLSLFAWVRVSLTRPILEVADYVRAYASGRAEAPPTRAGPREVAQLVEDVGRMTREMGERGRALHESEEQLREAQRMESAASLAGSLAHDFNNLLTGILGYARLLLDRVGPGDPIRRQLAAIETSAARAADLTAQLLTFSRRAAGRPEPVDLERLLEPILAAARESLPPDIEMTVEPPMGLWPVTVDGTQMERVVEALCTNAREAMPLGGRIVVSLANRLLGPADCRGNVDARPGRFVTVRVADTGHGIDPDVRRRMFEPFVTTKKTGGTAGFGLATAYGLVRGHDGWIEVASEPGRGAVFTIFVPAGERAQSAAPEPSPAPLVTAAPDVARSVPDMATPLPAVTTAGPGPTRSRTILVVDDETTILALAKDVLELDGYRVLTARNGEEAVRVYRESRGGIDLVLLDLTMPVMGGVECFRHLRRLDPAVRVVISSGFSSESSASEALREGALDFLQKPYEIQELARTVAGALARKPSLRAVSG